MRTACNTSTTACWDTRACSRAGHAITALMEKRTRLSGSLRDGHREKSTARRHGWTWVNCAAGSYSTLTSESQMKQLSTGYITYSSLEHGAT